MTAAPWFAVKCSEYQAKPVRTRAAAERQLVATVEAGNCSATDHRVVEVDREGNAR